MKSDSGPIDYEHFYKASLNACKDVTFNSTLPSLTFQLKTPWGDDYCPEVLKIYMSDTNGLTYFKYVFPINVWYDKANNDKKHEAKNKLTYELRRGQREQKRTE